MGAGPVITIERADAKAKAGSTDDAATVVRIM
jgi:hypothetical protein